MADDLANRWLLLVLQLPTQPSNARVKTWRRLQQLGAISVKHSVYVLPNSAQAVEDFEWLRSEIQGMKGQASIFTAASIDGVEEREIVEQFRSTRAEDYKLLRRDLARLKPRGRQAGSGIDRMRTIRQLRERLTEIRQVDFFAAPGADEAERELTALERVSDTSDTRQSPTVEPLERKDYKRRLWVTRPRPGVDRFASAWLIRRFIDPEARFGFVADAKDVKEAVAFDMYSGGFRHERDLCTFEVLQARFGIADAAVRRIGEVVHDIDLKEERYRAPHTVAIGILVDGLRSSFADDHALLEQGMVLFEALYRGLGEKTAHAATAASTTKAKLKSPRKPGGVK
jgi:hypothetical protein